MFVISSLKDTCKSALLGYSLIKPATASEVLLTTAVGMPYSSSRHTGFIDAEQLLAVAGFAALNGLRGVVNIGPLLWKSGKLEMHQQNMTHIHKSNQERTSQWDESKQHVSVSFREESTT